jgi:hypothetical protein
MSTQLHRYCNLSNAAKAKLYLSMGQQSTFEEPGAGNLHAGICAGAWGKPHAYCDYGPRNEEIEEIWKRYNGLRLYKPDANRKWKRHHFCSIRRIALIHTGVLNRPSAWQIERRNKNGK